MAGFGSEIWPEIYSLFNMMNKKTYILLRIEFLVVMVTFLFLVMSIMDIFRRRVHSPLIKSIFNILDTVSDSIVVYVIGAMQTAPIKNQLFPVWAIVLVNFRNSINFISGYGVPDRRGRRFTEWRNVIKLLGVGFLNGSSDSKFLLPLWSLWSMQILRSFYRFRTRNLAVRSIWHGRSSSLISEYMRTDRKQGNFRVLECNPETMQGYKYLVHGETMRNVTLKKPQYVVSLDPCMQQQRRKSNTSKDTLTTLDKIWHCDGHLLHHSNSQGDDLKDLSLAFALYRLLRCRLEDVMLHVDAIRINQKLIRARIVGKENDMDPSKKEENDMRAFRVMELQLAFLSDYFNTRFPMVFWCGLPSLFISLLLSVVTFAVVCWLSVDIRRVIKPPKGDTTHHVHGFNVDVSITWAFMFFMMFKEIWEIVTYLLSDWTRLLLTCLYQRFKCKCVRNGFAEGIILSFFKSKFITERWHGAIDQYVFLQSYDGKPRVWNLMHKLTVGLVEKKDEGAELGDAIDIPDFLKPAILEKLRSLNLTHGYLAKTITSLPENGPRMKYRWACLQLPTCSHIILVWHIATSLCEIKLATSNGVDLTKPGFLCNLLSFFTTCCSSKSYLMDEKKLSGELQKSYIIANSLSRYCAYLLVSKPEMIPDSFLVPKMVLQETIKHARDQILKDHDSLQIRYDKLMEEPNNADNVGERDNVLQQGAILGNQLISLESEEGRWVILAEVWAELLVHLAPSWNAASHKKSLESGGEFITHIWALLWHCGIEKSELWPVEDVPDDNNAPGARAPREDNAEIGSDQTKQEMQQADAETGIREEADTSRSNLMHRAAGAQVQNGKVENGVHGKDGVNGITQTGFVEGADGDGTGIDYQTEDHSDWEDMEEQNQMDAGEGIVSVLNDNIVTGSAMPLLHRNVVRGIKNLGSTCYFNAVLQSLLALDNLRVRLLGSDALREGSLALELKELFVATNNPSNEQGALLPNKLFETMCSLNPDFKHGVMEDSNNMITSLADGLRNEEPGIFESLFYGHCAKHVSCTACGHTSDTTDHLTLSLPIPSQGPVSLEECLDLYTRGEIEWPCEKCSAAAARQFSSSQTDKTFSGDDHTDVSNSEAQQKEQPNHSTEKQTSTQSQDELNNGTSQMGQTLKKGRKIEKDVITKLHITTAPPILIIQLKRFYMDNGTASKLTKPVRFPKTLDIRSLMSSRLRVANEDYKYSLVAVIVHDGKHLHEGHNFAYVRASRIRSKQESGDTESWFCANDRHVKKVNLEEVLNCQAYILFYEK